MASLTYNSYSTGDSGTITQAFRINSCVMAATTSNQVTMPSGFNCRITPGLGNNAVIWTSGDGTATAQAGVRYYKCPNAWTTCADEQRWLWSDSSTFRATLKVTIDNATNCIQHWLERCYITGSTSGNFVYPESPKDKLRRIMRERYAPAFLRDRLEAAADDRERRARETLRKVVGPEEYRRFLTRGFVLVRGRSGLVYQCWPGHSIDTITKVWRHGACVERLCVYLTGDFPPTDELIMRALLIMNDEADFRSRANVHKAAHQTRRGAAAPAVGPAGKSLVQIYKSLKGQAG